MVYLAFIYHMHQPYYKNLLTGESGMPWVRLHGIKDYLDMVEMLEKFPSVRMTFNLVPSLIEQIEDYTQHTVKDTFLELSYKPAAELNDADKEFIRDRFFSINKERVISLFPRYYDLYFKKQAGRQFNTQDYLDLQVWFNLAWFDPSYRSGIPELRYFVNKARFFTEEEKRFVLDKQTDILKKILPAYRRFLEKRQIEVTVSPYYHPILPLLFNTNVAKEANPRNVLPKVNFAYPQDAAAQIRQAVELFQSRFGEAPSGMWPSEEAVSEHIVPLFIGSGIRWIVADEGILFKSFRRKKRDTRLLYQPHLLKREEGELNIIFRDRNLSDLLGFVYYNWKAADAVQNFMMHLENISLAFKNEDILVTVAMDGENAWEYYPNDGHDFLELLYQRLAEAPFVTTTTPREYLAEHPARSRIRRLSAGSWIYADFTKWISSNPYKNRAWECLAEARKLLEKPGREAGQQALARKQMDICEGSDWFWWYGDGHEDFDPLFRMHLRNFYSLMGEKPPDYLNAPL